MGKQLRIALFVLGVVLSACSSATPTPAELSGDVAATTLPPVGGEAEASATATCQGPSLNVPWTAEAAVEAVLLSAGSDSEPRVEAVR